MSASFNNQVLAQMELHDTPIGTQRHGPRVAEASDEMVARLYREGIKLTEMTTDQAEYLGVSSPTTIGIDLAVLIPQIGPAGAFGWLPLSAPRLAPNVRGQSCFASTDSGAPEALRSQTRRLSIRRDPAFDDGCFR